MDYFPKMQVLVHLANLVKLHFAGVGKGRLFKELALRVSDFFPNPGKIKNEVKIDICFPTLLIISNPKSYLYVITLNLMQWD